MGRPFVNIQQTVTKSLKSRIFLTQVFGALVFLTLLFSAEGWESRNALLEGSLYLAGVVLVALCLVGRAWGLSYIAGKKNRMLVTTGPYSLCRNPLYFSSFLGAVGLGLCTETFTMTAAVLVAFALYYPGVIRREELELRELFGAEFEAYQRSVPAFFPSFKAFVEDETMLISVRAFRNGLRDLGFFIVVVGLLEFVEALHRAGVLPTLLKLY
jgi:protein-S-isoprenylcysteine O-methyltransferase Ste14